MNLIAIETISEICSISLFVKNKNVDTIESSDDIKHTRNLPILFNKLIKRNSLDIKNIDFIAVSIGPGSYTGIKVGVNFSKGLAFGLGIPIVPINSLEAINYNLNCKEEYYIALFSHKDFVYYQKYENGLSKSIQKCESVEKLDNLKIFGFNLNKISNIKYERVKLSSINIGKFASMNYLDLGTKDYDSISSLCISRVS